MFVRHASKKAGLPPGTLVYVGEEKQEPVRITVISYDEEGMREERDLSPEDCRNCIRDGRVTWINVDGVHDMHALEGFGKVFGLHPLVLEDTANTNQRPKLDDFGDYVYVVLKMLTTGDREEDFLVEQVSLIVGDGFVLSFQERSGDVFDPVRERIAKGRGRIRKAGADYLFYALMDMVVDNYFKVLENMGDRLEDLQEEVLVSAEPTVLADIQRVKREIIHLRRSVWPLREVIGILERTETRIITTDIRVFLRDLYDHTIQVIDTVESFRDVVSGVLDIYLSMVSNRMNEVMKVLTIIATLFIPVTFLAGVYGMNFRYIPELDWKPAYGVFWGIVAVTMGIMVWWFKKRKWL